MHMRYSHPAGYMHMRYSHPAGCMHMRYSHPAGCMHTRYSHPAGCMHMRYSHPGQTWTPDYPLDPANQERGGSLWPGSLTLTLLVSSQFSSMKPRSKTLYYHIYIFYDCTAKVVGTVVPASPARPASQTMEWEVASHQPAHTLSTRASPSYRLSAREEYCCRKNSHATCHTAA